MRALTATSPETVQIFLDVFTTLQIPLAEQSLLRVMTLVGVNSAPEFVSELRTMFPGDMPSLWPIDCSMSACIGSICHET